MRGPQCKFPRWAWVAAITCGIAIAEVPAVAQRDGAGSAGTTKDAPAAASDAPLDVPSLELSQSQRDAIYQSISNRQAKKDTAPVGFRAAVGAHVPDSIALEPLPKTIVELVPKAAAYEYAFVANQVLIVEPRSRTVIEVIQ